MSWHVPLWHWLAHAALGGLLVLGAGCLAVRLCRQPVRRLRLIELTLFGCLVVPWLGLLPAAPRWQLGLLEEVSATPEAVAVDDLGPPAPADDELAASLGPAPAVPLAESSPLAPRAESRSRSERTTFRAPEPAEAEPAAPSRLSLSLLLVLAYCAAAGVLLARWLAGLLQLLRLCRSARPVSPEVASVFRAVAGLGGDGVRLLTSDRLPLPLMFAGRRPAILLPAELCAQGDTPELRYCLAHEWSHVERMDVWRWHLAAVVQFLFFYLPLFWWLRRQLRLCQDYLADARAAEQAAEAEDYAEYLVLLARRRTAEPAVVALGIGGRHSNLYRRVHMLIDNDKPLETRCRRAWTAAACLAALSVLAAASAVRLDAGEPPPVKKGKEDGKNSDKPAEGAKGETLKYTGKVTDKTTGKPIAGAAVVVRRSLLNDPRPGMNNKVLEESKHKTDADGKYTFTIPPEQSGERYLYIELDVEHDEYAPKKGFGYALSMIRKNEKMGGRPFFEHVELWPGKPITGRIETPDGERAAGVKVLAYSRTTKVKEGEFEYGSFDTTQTDAKGRFKLVLTTPGEAAIWILPKKYAPSAHKLKPGQRGDLGLFGLQKGITFTGKVFDAKGNPVPNVSVNIDRASVPEEERVNMVADAIGRAARTDDKGAFTIGPLPPGEYTLKPDEYHSDPTDLKYDRTRRPLDDVFVPMRLTLKEGAKLDPVEVRAVPHVVIEAQHYDAKGKKTRGHAFYVFGRMDGGFFHRRGQQDANGKVTALVPHGLQEVRLDLMTNAHGILRWRKTKAGKLQNSRRVNLGTVNADVKGIEIIKYTAPIVLVKVVAKDGGKLENVAVTAEYPEGKGRYERGLTIKGRNSDVSFEGQSDGRFRSECLFPDEETTVTGHADGYESASLKVKLPEGETKEVTITLEKSK